MSCLLFSTTFFRVCDKFLHIHRQYLCNFKKRCKVGLGTIAHIGIDRTKTLAIFLESQVWLIPFSSKTAFMRFNFIFLLHFTLQK